MLLRMISSILQSEQLKHYTNEDLNETTNYYRYWL